MRIRRCKGVVPEKKIPKEMEVLGVSFVSVPSTDRMQLRVSNLIYSLVRQTMSYGYTITYILMSWSTYLDLTRKNECDEREEVMLPLPGKGYKAFGIPIIFDNSLNNEIKVLSETGICTSGLYYLQDIINGETTTTPSGGGC